MNPPLFAQADRNTVFQEEASKLVTQEEFEAIVQKMQGYMQLAVGNLPQQDELYLEQQLSELLGFEVLAELDGFRLPQTLGIVAARPHLRRHPTDQLADHANLPEAGMATCRSSFGWFADLNQVSQEMQLREQYTLSMPMELLPQWGENAAKWREWLKWRKVCILNPLESTALVAVIGNSESSTVLTEQYGGSPELIRQVKAWSIPTQGKLMIFFINDPQNLVALGPRPLLYDHR